MTRENFLKEKILEQSSLKDFAKKINMPYTTLFSILKNVGGASIDNILKICKGLGIQADVLNGSTIYTNTTNNPPIVAEATTTYNEINFVPKVGIKFPERLNQLLSENNLTIYDLASILGLSPATISRYINGKMSPKLPTIEMIAMKLNVNPLWLTGQSDDKTLAVNDLKIRDVKSIAADLEKMMDELSFAAHGGTVEDEADKELLQAALKTAMEIAKSQAKKKFTPKSKR
ncbi:helix-turn-helix transcriptional regulator [Veillonella sp.]|uniref:helix-turn-helix transcriptional regulator n=1 Tax=Veillonella sp. TaxID=1926307 RepID=UPI0025F195F1|nr:helix-turn-helix transcriptional regulator [Veillonella sp.]